MAGPHSKLTEAQKAMACEMREDGKTVPQIVAALAAEGVTISIGAVSWCCLVNGADLPPERRQRNPTKPKHARQRGGYIVRPFTPAEDDRLLQLESDGMGYSAIGRELKRRPNSIRGRLATLARLEARAEEAG